MTTKSRKRIVVSWQGPPKHEDTHLLPPDYRRPSIGYLDKVERKLYAIRYDYVTYHGKREEHLHRPTGDITTMVVQYSVHLPLKCRNLFATGTSILGYTMVPHGFTRTTVVYDQALDPYFDHVFYEAQPNHRHSAGVWNKTVGDRIDDYAKALEGWAIPT